MLVPGAAMTLLGLYVVLFSGRISERARREKWAFGGNQVFTVVAGFGILVFGAVTLQASIDDLLSVEHGSRSMTGWTWFWLIGGILIFLLGISQIAFSTSWSRRMTETKAKTGALYPVSRRGTIILGVFQAALGASWAIGSLPI